MQSVSATARQISVDRSSPAAAVAKASAQAAWITRFPSPFGGGAVARHGALAGLVGAVKDNIDVAGWPTTAACPSFAYTPEEHAVVVQKLLDAGASVAGKTNLDQFACGLNGTRSPYGAVPNAFDAACVSGGSSSGSAYVVAAGEVDFALGTDTAGSGRVPAGLNNIVGLKPSRGLVSARGVVPAAQSADCVSIFARSVALAWRVLEVVAGHDVQDPYSRALPLRGDDFAPALRFGVPDELEFCGDALAEAAFGVAQARLRALGGTPVKIAYAPLRQAADMLYGSALVAERYAAIREFFDAQPDQVVEPVRSIIASGQAYSAADLCDAQARLRLHGQQAAAMWNDIDVLLVPTAPTHYKVADMLRDPVALNRNLGAYTNFVNLLDYCALSVPSSMRPDGLPFGITLIAPAGRDWALARLGERYHHATGLTQGATGEALPPMQLQADAASQPAPGPAPLSGTALAPPSAAPTVELAVVGAHLSGMPLNGQLRERGAQLRASTATAPHYRLYALPGSTPPKPGLLRVAPGQGAPIAVEVWEMPLGAYGSFVAAIPAPLGIGTLELADGRRVQGFLCEAQALQAATDITGFGGWRNYIASITSIPQP